MQMDMKQWVENWKRVGPILEQIKAEELRTPDYHERLYRKRDQTGYFSFTREYPLSLWESPAIFGL